jgi:hypothetical protein
MAKAKTEFEKFTKEEDKTLERSFPNYNSVTKGFNWNDWAAKNLPGRSGPHCQNQWETRIRKKLWRKHHTFGGQDENAAPGGVVPVRGQDNNAAAAGVVPVQEPATGDTVSEQDFDGGNDDVLTDTEESLGDSDVAAIAKAVTLVMQNEEKEISLTQVLNKDMAETFKKQSDTLSKQSDTLSNTLKHQTDAMEKQMVRNQESATQRQKNTKQALDLLEQLVTAKLQIKTPRRRKRTLETPRSCPARPSAAGPRFVKRNLPFERNSPFGDIDSPPHGDTPRSALKYRKVNLLAYCICFCSFLVAVELLTLLLIHSVDGRTPNGPSRDSCQGFRTNRQRF